MKCVNCGVENNLKERTANQGRCKNCNHTFVFEPKSTDAKYKFTDPFFQNIINDISVNYTLHFTRKQFFYALERRASKRNNLINGWKGLGCFLIFPPIAMITVGISFIVGIILIFVNSYQQSKSEKNKRRVRKDNAKFLQISGIVILLAGIFYSLSINSFPLFILSVILGMPLIYFGTIQIQRLKFTTEAFVIDQNIFQDWINRWEQINGKITNMLPSPRQQNTPVNINPDITAYSFDRLIVCDSAEVAQLLIANNFHFENNCAVLSITGYPENIFSTVMEMLKRNPDLKVYALHNASPRGVSLINHLRTSPTWFLNTDVTIYDLGLLPRQFINKSKAFVQQKQEYVTDAKNLSVDVKRDLSEAEIEWLAEGRFIELESYTPKKLIRVITRGIAQSRQPDTIQSDSGGTTFISGYDDYDSDSDIGIAIFAADSFG
ncbi:MAG: hypothetical protein AAGM40_17680 [Cyanobacteria bacterium J06573_2]